MLKRIQNYHQNLYECGDTIVEVLIAIAILSSLLVGAYYLADNSLNGERASQEQTEATTLAQSQIETLKAVYDQRGSITTIAPGDPGCFDETGTVYSASNCYVSDNAPSTYTTRSICYGSYTWCYFVTINDLGATTVATESSSVSLETYEILVSWPRAGSQDTNQVIMYYRPN